MACHFVAYKGRHQQGLSDQAGFGHVVEGAKNTLGLGLAFRGLIAGLGVAPKCPQLGQIVRAEPLIRIRIDKGLQDRQPLCLAARGKAELFNPVSGLVKAFHHGAALEHLGAVFVPLQEPGSFQPGDRGDHLGPGVPVFRVDCVLHGLVPHKFAGGEDHIAFPVPFGLAKSPQDPGDVLSIQPGQSRQPELGLYVLLVIEQDAFGVEAVAAGPSRLLYVVFQGSGDVQVDHQPHILFVDAHAEGVGGADDADTTLYEAILDVSFAGRVDPRVKGLRLQASVRQVFGRGLSAFPGGAIHYTATGKIRRKSFREQRMEARVFFSARHGLHLEPQVITFNSAAEYLQLHAQVGAEMVDYFRLDILLGGCTEALDRWKKTLVLGGELLDETGRIEIVGPKVVSPLGKAVGLIEHPAADLAVADGVAERAVAQLFRRHIEDAHIPQSNALEDLSPLRSREKSAQGGRVGGPCLVPKVVHLVLHEGLQGRYYNCQDRAPQIAGQGRELVAEALAGPCGQYREQMLITHGPCHDCLLKAPSIGIGRFRPES